MSVLLKLTNVRAENRRRQSAVAIPHVEQRLEPFFYIIQHRRELAVLPRSSAKCHIQFGSRVGCGHRKYL
jgi:hypothetical protein